MKVGTLKLLTMGKEIRTYTYIQCPCGCKGKFWQWLNPHKESTYTVMDRYANDDVQTIRRDSDGVLFSVGDTVQLVNALGQKQSVVVIFEIQVEQSGFMQIHSWVVGRHGMVCIRQQVDAEMWNAEHGDCFTLVENITKKR